MRTWRGEHRRPRAVQAQISAYLRTLEQPVDWQEVLLDLRRGGWRLQWIAEAINAPVSTVHGWCAGSRPEFEYGRALLRLHTTITQRDQQIEA